MRVFAVWEPILVTDWAKPSSGVLDRLTDRRIAQYWDKDHRVALRLARDAKAPQPKPSCCENDGILWDLAAVYPIGVTWNQAIPPAIFFDGPVVERKSQIESAVVTSSSTIGTLRKTINKPASE